MSDAFYSAADALVQHLEAGAGAGLEQLADGAVRSAPQMLAGIAQRLVAWRRDRNLPLNDTTRDGLATDLRRLAADDDSAASDLASFSNSDKFSSNAGRDVNISTTNVTHSSIDNANFGFQNEYYRPTNSDHE